jgi:predicted transcriptional regulator
MSVVTIRVASLEESMRQLKRAFEGEYQGEFISFVTMDLLWQILTPPRFALIEAMAGKGPMSMRCCATGF